MKPGPPPSPPSPPSPKPFLTLEEQCDTLLVRGLEIDDRAQAAAFIHKTNYFRLSGYLRPFQVDPAAGDNSFMAGTSLTQVRRIYEFDQQLRLLVGTAIAEFEVEFRAALAYKLAEKLTPTGYTLEHHYRRYGDYQDCMQRLDEERRRSKEPFMKHHNDKYSAMEPPIWVVVECASFGLLSKMMSNLRESSYVKQIASTFGLPQDYFNTAVRHLSYTRNICAHHGRLWNRQVVEKLATMKSSTHEISIRVGESETYRIFQTLVLLSYLTRRANSNSDFEGRCLQLLAQHKDLLKHMGFPEHHALDRL
jgi:abortive infection bacteriophage resistance protein